MPFCGISCPRSDFRDFFASVFSSVLVLFSVPHAVDKSVRRFDSANRHRIRSLRRLRPLSSLDRDLIGADEHSADHCKDEQEQAENGGHNSPLPRPGGHFFAPASLASGSAFSGPGATPSSAKRLLGRIGRGVFRCNGIGIAPGMADDAAQQDKQECKRQAGQADAYPLCGCSGAMRDVCSSSVGHGREAMGGHLIMQAGACRLLVEGTATLVEAPHASHLTNCRMGANARP